MQFLEKLDKGIDAFLKYFTGVLMVLLTIIVCAMVISRYVFRIQMGGIEELPVYFMCVCIWLGGIRVSLWIAYSFELIGTGGMTIYTYVNTIKYALKVVKG